MNSLENPWAATDEQLANPWEFGNGSSVLEKDQDPKPKAEYKPFSTPKGRIVFEDAKYLASIAENDADLKKGCIFVNLHIVFYGGGIATPGVLKQVLYLNNAMNKIKHSTIGSDDKSYPVRYRVTGDYLSDSAAISLMQENKINSYDDRLGFARISSTYKDSAHNDQEKNSDGSFTEIGRASCRERV